jgi:hypothetical protein
VESLRHRADPDPDTNADADADRHTYTHPVSDTDATFGGGNNCHLRLANDAHFNGSRAVV